MTTRRDFLTKAAIGGAAAVWVAPVIESVIVPAAALSTCPVVTGEMWRDAADNKTWHFLITNNASVTRISQIVVVNGGGLRINSFANESGAVGSTSTTFHTTGSVTINYTSPAIAMSGSTGFKLVNNSNNAFATNVNVIIGGTTKVLAFAGIGTSVSHEVKIGC